MLRSRSSATPHLISAPCICHHGNRNRVLLAQIRGNPGWRLSMKSALPPGDISRTSCELAVCARAKCTTTDGMPFFWNAPFVSWNALVRLCKLDVLLHHRLRLRSRVTSFSCTFIATSIPCCKDLDMIDITMDPKP